MTMICIHRAVVIKYPFDEVRSIIIFLELAFLHLSFIVKGWLAVNCEMSCDWLLYVPGAYIQSVRFSEKQLLFRLEKRGPLGYPQILPGLTMGKVVQPIFTILPLLKLSILVSSDYIGGA